MSNAVEAIQTTDHITFALNEFGLSDVEVAVYKAALALGSRPASIVAQKAGLKRGHTYNVLQTLMQKGIVQEYVRNGVRHFTCSPPQSLLSLVQRREEQLAEQKENLLKVLPELERLRNPHNGQPRVRFFKGVEGIKEIFEDMLRVPDQKIRAVTDIASSWTFLRGEPRRWLDNFIARRAERNIWWYGIMNDSDQTEQALATRRWLKRKVKLVQGLAIRVEISVYGPKVAITSAEDDIFGVLLENEPIAATLSSMHEAVWNILPDHPLNNREEDC